MPSRPTAHPTSAPPGTHPTGTHPTGPRADAARRRLRRLLRTRVLAHRRLLAATSAALAVAAALRVVTGPGPSTETLMVAARDLPSGVVLTHDDLVPARWPEGAVPSGIAGHPAGRTLAAPLRRGEPVTDVRLVGPSLVEGYPGLVALPVRIPDPAAASLLSVGDSVDLVASDPESATAAVLARSTPVLALPPEAGDGAGSAGQGAAGRLVVFGLPPGEVEEVSVAAARSFLTIAFSR